ncbi:MAG: hypothetical protein IKN42_04550, partial [Elusimicrobia bacterium]|nr:hypothetical protein [Elusimicrobiota bacterium]
MANILIVSQKELTATPIFKQDKNVLELYNILKIDNDVKILFVHKNTKLNTQTENEKNETKQEKDEQNKLIFNVSQFCIRDMMKNKMFKTNINNFVKDYKIDTIIFMSEYMAKLVMPYIENMLENLNVLCDLRLTNISYLLQQYKYEKEKDEPNFNILYKSFKINFIQLLPILKYTDNIILDEDSDTYLLKSKEINNIISPKQVKDFIKTKNNLKTEEKKYTSVEIIISRNNYFSNINIKS